MAHNQAPLDFSRPMEPQSQRAHSPAVTDSTASAAPTPAGHNHSSSTGYVPAPSPTVHNKPPRILACVLCQHRKIKCDRTFPCANCLKANVTCTPSTPAPARKRRRPNQDLQERLARCEELLKEYATAKPDSPPTAKPPSPRPETMPELGDPLPKWKPAGKLVQEDDGVRFVDSFLIGTVYDELKSMRKIVDEEMTFDEPTPLPADDLAKTPDDNSELIFGAAESPTSNPEDLTPSATHIIRLWRIYLDRCNPLTKIIHVPTLHPYVLEATSASPRLPKNIEALLFAIYTLATVAMTKEECEELLGMSREKALSRFGQGVRATLTRLGFLKTHDLFTLQALVIYLISLQGRYNRHASWILNGVVIRIAQKMGLHRDGELLGLKPFETELRRRLWWQIIMVDAKYAMMSGLSNTLLPRGWDTQEPRNIDDEDLKPDIVEPIKHKKGPTDMILVMVVFKIAKTMIRLPGMEMIHELEAAKSATAPNREKVAEYRKVIEELTKDLDEVLTIYSSPTAGPLHELARQTKDHVMTKLSALGKPTAEPAEWRTEVYDHASNAFRLAIENTSHTVEQYQMRNYPGWDWYFRLHFQLDVFAYLVGQLCQRTTGRLVERGWSVVEGVYQYRPEFYETSQKMYYQLAHFVFKAWRKREEALHKALGHAPEVPKCVQKLRALIPGSDDSVKSESGRTPNDIFHFVNTGSIPQQVNGMDLGGLDGAPFDTYMSNYFDFNSALDFDVWGNGQAAPAPAPAPQALPHSQNGLPSLDQQIQPTQGLQLQDMLPYGIMGQGTWT